MSKLSERYACSTSNGVDVTDDDINTLFPYGSGLSALTDFTVARCPRNINNGVSMAKCDLIETRYGNSISTYPVAFPNEQRDNYGITLLYHSGSGNTDPRTRNGREMQGCVNKINKTADINAYLNPEYDWSSAMSGYHIASCDYDKICIYPTITAYNLSNGTIMRDISYKQWKTMEGYIPCYLNFIFYTGEIGNNGRRANERLSLAFVELNSISGIANNNTYTNDTEDVDTIVLWGNNGRKMYLSYPMMTAFNQYNAPTYIGTTKYIDFDAYGTDLTGGNVNPTLLEGSHFGVDNIDLLQSGLPQYQISYLRDDWEECNYGVAFYTNNQIISILNALGFAWADNENSARYSDLGENCTDIGIHYPNVNEGGVTGSGSLGNNKLNEMRKVVEPYGDPHNPYKGYNKNAKYNNTTVVDYTPSNRAVVTPISLFNTAYACTYNQVLDFNHWIWNSDADEYQKIQDNLNMYNNPIDAIVSLRMYPFNLNSKAGHSPDPVVIVLGRVSSSVSASSVLFSDYDCIIDLGFTDIPAKYGNFLDLPPYTKATLYLPYLNNIEIPMEYFAGKRLSVKYIVDIMTGGCSAMIYADNILITHCDGIIGVDIPVSTKDNQTALLQKASNRLEYDQYTGKDSTGFVSSNAFKSYLSNPFKAAADLGSFIGTSIGNAITGSNFSAGTEYERTVDKLNLEYNSIKANIQTESSSTPSCSNWMPQKAFVIIERDIPELPSAYAHEVGYVCNKTLALNNIEGYTEIVNPQLDNVVCTESERSMIANMLQSGVIF